MVNSKKVLMLFILTMAFFSILSVAKADLGDISYKVNVINDKAAPGEKLEYNVSLMNGGSDPVKLSLNILFTGITELTPNAFTLQPGDSKTVHIALTIKSSQKPGRVLINLFVFDDKGNSINPPIYLQGEILKSPKLFENVKINKIQIEPDVLNPQTPFNISFEVYNPVEKIVVPLEIVSDDGFKYVVQNQTVEEGKSTISLYNVSLPSDMPPGNHTFTVKLIFAKDVVSESSVVSEVSSYAKCVIVDSKNVTMFGKSYIANVKNIGTKGTTCVVSSQITGVEKMLLRKATEGYTFEGNKIIWNVPVKANSEVVIKYNVSYVPILLIPFLIIAGIGGAWYLTRKVTIKKELVDYKRYQGFMDLKIQLKIKNLTNTELKDVKIYDSLPAFIKEVRDYGTIPGKVKKKGKSKIVEWELDSIKPKEERVLSYKIRTSLEVLGKIIFKPAKVEYKDNKGIKREENSNILTIEIE